MASVFEDGVDRAYPVAVEAVKDAKDASFVRASAEYKPTYQRFMVKTKKFTQQYSHIYTKRLMGLRDAVTESAKAAWSDVAKVPIVPKIIDLRVGETRIVIGTVYKEMRLKPCILDEFSSERVLAPPKKLKNYSADDDSLILEDESGRVALVGASVPVSTLVTGVVMAVRGTVLDTGELDVAELVTAGVPRAPRPLPKSDTSAFVLLISGLEFGERGSRGPTQLLTEFTTGFLGSGRDQSGISKIVRIIVCGGLVTGDRDDAGDKTFSLEDQAKIVQPMKDADLTLSQMAAGVPVDVMPGVTDPANFALPQQPFHPCLLPRTARYSSLRTVTNPYEAEVGGVRLLGCSGQAVRDITRYTTSPVCMPANGRLDGKPVSGGGGGGGSGDGEPADAGDEPMEIEPTAPPAPGSESKDTDSKDAESSALTALHNTLVWRHMAPTAPDTLGCYPFYEFDPFIIEERPHVYFTANADNYEASTVTGDDGVTTRLITVPNFSKTNTVVLLDLKNLASQPIRFDST